MKFIEFVKAFFAATALTTASVLPALAVPVPIITGVQYNGSGCPIGTLPPPFDPLTNSVSFLFGIDYYAQGNNVVQKFKTCNFLVSIQIPRGYQLSIYNAEYNGYVDFGTTGTLNAKYALIPGQVVLVPSLSTSLTQNFYGGPYNVTHYLVTNNQVISACTTNVKLRVNTSMLATGAGIATVGSLDITKGVTFFYYLQPC
jgi:Domain of unknown function (DUF4360)